MKKKPGEENSPQNPMVGVIDIGSNSIRLVVYDGLSRTPVCIHNEKATCELARGLDEDGNLHADKMEMVFGNLVRFAAILDRMEVGTVKVVATSAVRVAQNGPVFATMAEMILGKPVEIISGEEEARLAALGVLSAFPDANGVVGDLGGGSLELAELKKGKIGEKVTLRLGHQRLADIADEGGLEAVAEVIDQHLQAVPWIRKLNRRDFYAVGGGWRRLAELHMARSHYPLHVVDHYCLDGEAMAEFLHPKRLPVHRDDAQKETEFFKGFSKRHAEILTVSAMVMEGILRHGKPGHVVFSTSGLREGILFDMLPKAERNTDPLLSTCEEIARRHACLPPNVSELQTWVMQIFEDMEDHFRRLCFAACILSDLSQVETRDYKSRNAFARILNFPMNGMDHNSRIFLAMAVHARYAGNVRGWYVHDYLEYMDPDDVDRAKEVGLTLRLAISLSSHIPGILPQTRLDVCGDELVLTVPKGLPFASGDVVKKHFKALANAMAMKGVMRESGALKPERI